MGTLEQLLEVEDAKLKDVDDDEALKASETNGPVEIPFKGVAAAVKVPNKLIDEDKRQTERAKISVYLGYLYSSGGWSF